MLIRYLHQYACAFDASVSLGQAMEAICVHHVIKPCWTGYRLSSVPNYRKKGVNKMGRSNQRQSQNQKPRLREILKQLATICLPKNGGRRDDWAFNTLYHFVDELGSDYVGRALPDQYEFDTPKQCYSNSTILCIGYGCLTYCEGYVLPGKIPIPLAHAWCVDSDGGVVDTTLADPTGWEYCGVQIKEEYVIKILSERGYHAGVLDNWQNRWPLLTGEHRWEDVVIQLPLETARS